MAHFTRIRNVGMWTVTSTLLSAEMEAFDAHQFAAINGDAGGTWAPVGTITIGGNGLNVTGLFSAGQVDALTVTGGGDGILIDVGNFFACRGALDLGIDGVLTGLSGSTIEIEAGCSFLIDSGADVDWQSGSHLHVNAGATLTCAGELDVTGTEVVSGTLQCSAPSIVQLSGTVQFLAGTVSHSSGVTLSRDCHETLSGNSATTAKRRGTVTDANGTYGAEKDSWVFAAISTDRTITLRKTASGSGPAPVDGVTVRFTCRVVPAGVDVTFQNEDTSPVATYTAVAAQFWVEFEYYSAAWHAAEWGGVTPSAL